MQQGGGHFSLSATDTFPANNGAVQNKVQVTKPVMLLVAEAELGALFINTKWVAPMHQMLLELRHPQLSTPNQTVNLMVDGVSQTKSYKK